MKYETLTVGEMATNCYIVWWEDKTAVIIDPGDEGVEIAQRINELGLKPTAVLLTHGHFDHVLGALDLKLIFNVPVMMDQKDNFLINRSEKTANYFLKRKTNKPPVLRTSPLKKGDLRQFDLEIISTPGHTPGSVGYYFPKERWLFDGDVLFSAGFEGETEHQYSNKTEMAKSIKKILSLPKGTLVLPGHGASFII